MSTGNGPRLKLAYIMLTNANYRCGLILKHASQFAPVDCLSIDGCPYTHLLHHALPIPNSAQ